LWKSKQLLKDSKDKKKPWTNQKTNMVIKNMSMQAMVSWGIIMSLKTTCILKNSLLWHSTFALRDQINFWSLLKAQLTLVCPIITLLLEKFSQNFEVKATGWALGPKELRNLS
jgi:hypothetical protein